MSRKGQFGITAILLALLFGGAAVGAAFFAIEADRARRALQAERIKAREIERRNVEESERLRSDRSANYEGAADSRPSDPSIFEKEKAVRALKSEERRALSPENLTADLRAFFSSCGPESQESAAVARALPQLRPIVELLAVEKAVAARAFAMLAEFPGMKFSDFLTAFQGVGSTDVSIAEAAGRAAGKLRKADDPASDLLIERALKDAAPTVRIFAIESIAKSSGDGLGDGRRLLGAYDDPIPAVRDAAGRALARRDIARAAFDDIVVRIGKTADEPCEDLVAALLADDPSRAIAAFVDLASAGKPMIAHVLLDRLKSLPPDRRIAFALLPLHRHLAEDLAPKFFAEFSRHESAADAPVRDIDEALARLWKLDQDGLGAVGFAPTENPAAARARWVAFRNENPDVDPRSRAVFFAVVECRPLLAAAREATDDDPILESFWRAAAIWREPDALGVAVTRLFSRTKERREIVEFLVKECGRAGQLAAERVRDTRDAAAVDHWLRAVADGHGKISPATIKAMILDPATRKETIDVLVDALLAADDPLARDAVAEIVIAKTSPYAIDLLPVLLATGDDRLWPIVKDALTSESPRDRALAVRALRDMKLGARLREVTDFARDEDPLVRLEYARLLARYSEPTAQATLLSMTRDPASFVREAAAFALGKSSGPRNVAVLKDRIDDEAIDVANAALSSLVELGVVDRVPQLIEQVDHVLVGPRTRRFLNVKWRVSFETKAEWLDWWEKSGKVEAPR